LGGASAETLEFARELPYLLLNEIRHEADRPKAYPFARKSNRAGADCDDYPLHSVST